jgi:hypothetical protein
MHRPPALCYAVLGYYLQLTPLCYAVLGYYLQLTPLCYAVLGYYLQLAPLCYAVLGCYLQLTPLSLSLSPSPFPSQGKVVRVKRVSVSKLLATTLPSCSKPPI